MPKTVPLAVLAIAFAAASPAARAQTPIPPSPQDFVLTAAQGDQYEILAARVAEVEGQDPRVRAFAQQMIKDHTRLSDDLRQAAAASKLSPPKPGLSSDQASLLGALQGLRGAAFDKAYARQQALAHAQAALVQESFAEGGGDANLRTAAQSALPTIKDHLKAARQLVIDVGGS